MLHSQRTMSLIDAPTALPIALTSGSGSDTAAKARWLVIEWLNGVAGASLKRVGGASALRAARSSRGLGAPRRDRRAAPRRARCPRSRGSSLHALHELLELVLQRRGEQLGDAELVGVGARLARRLDGARLGREVEHAGRHRDAGLAVDGGVVDLAVEADAAVGQALDDVELPERAAAVEQHRVQPRGERLELRDRARLGQHHVADVVVEVDVVVVDPDRVGEVERHQRELAREHRRQVHPLGDVRLHRLVEAFAAVARRRLEQVAGCRRASASRRFPCAGRRRRRCSGVSSGS